MSIPIVGSAPTEQYTPTVPAEPSASSAPTEPPEADEFDDDYCGRPQSEQIITRDGQKKNHSC
jgi:hypothetical protein